MVSAFESIGLLFRDRGAFCRCRARVCCTTRRIPRGGVPNGIHRFPCQFHVSARFFDSPHYVTGPGVYLRRPPGLAVRHGSLGERQKDGDVIRFVSLPRHRFFDSCFDNVFVSLRRDHQIPGLGAAGGVFEFSFLHAAEQVPGPVIEKGRDGYVHVKGKHGGVVVGIFGARVRRPSFRYCGGTGGRDRRGRLVGFFGFFLVSRGDVWRGGLLVHHVRQDHGHDGFSLLCIAAAAAATFLG
mmetsp:Transcript_17306/g.35579  ORF Transcript_17306/g.35579 Transcript_17306/m.35579 type:complete len:240 (+) Transcript_17306:260-979(+)